MNIRRNNVFIVYLLAAIGLAIFAFYDLQISLAILNEKQVFSLVFEFFGELPVFLMAGVSSLILLKTAKFNNKIKLVIHHLFVIKFFLLSVLMGAFLFYNYLGLGDKGIFVMGGLLIVVNIIVYKLLDFEDREKLRKIALFGVALFFLVFITFNIMKFAWGRERLRHMAGDYSGFTPWYLPQGKASGNEFMSFPSGHAANATAILWFLLFPKINKHAFSKYFSIFWIISVMYSRVVLGAHFSSDVTVGMLVTFTWFLILNKAFKFKAG